MSASALPGLVRALGPGADDISIRTPLGIRFWDPARDVAVSDALRVMAWPAGRPDDRRSAIRTNGGVYAFHGLPGMRHIEYPDMGAGTASPPVARRFAVRVDDRDRRFLAVAFHVDLPQEGIYPTNTMTSAGTRLPGFFLYTAPTRASASGLAVIRTQLTEDATGTPAAFAVVEVEAPHGRVVHGIADERGSAAVVFSLPPFRPGASASPPSSLSGTQSWPLRIRVRYSPQDLRPVPGAGLPDLRTVLGQGPARLRSAVTDPTLVDELSAGLRFGIELTVRTSGSPYLIVGAATSPP